jgi:small subunit ribosomal protein S5
MARFERRGRNQRAEDSNIIEKVIHVNRVSKVVKGGRNFSFSSLVVVGDGAGRVGIGHGKAKEVPEAIRKAGENARKNMKPIPLVGTTVPHRVLGHCGASSVVLRPAHPGTGVIAGPLVRAVMDCVGVRDVLTKVLGSTNAHNLSKAVMDALESLESAEQFATRTGKPIEQVMANYQLAGLAADAR